MKRIILAALALVLMTGVVGAQDSEIYGIGTGFLISADGLVLTNRHVVSKCVDPPEVSYVVSGRSKAKVIAQGRKLDLALLKTDFRDVPFLRLRTKGGKISLPVVDEIIHTVGFFEGEWNPRGGQVIQSSDPELLTVPGQPLFSKAGSVIRLHSGPGASGSPVLDENGLLIGIIWAKTKEHWDEPWIHILNNVALYSFLRIHGVPIPTSDIGPNPISKAKGVWEHIVQMGEVLGGGNC